MKNIIQTIIIGAFAALVFAVPAFAQKGDVNTKQIKFARGKNSATVTGVIRDRMTSDLYRVRGRAGQVLTVVFTSTRRDVDVCVMTPDGQDTCGKRKYTFKLAADGEVEILIDGHRENIRYSLTVSVK